MRARLTFGDMSPCRNGETTPTNGLLLYAVYNAIVFEHSLWQRSDKGRQVVSANIAKGHLCPRVKPSMKSMCR